MLNKLTKIKRLLLIGKEIWHNKRSMRGRFIIYLLSLVLLAGSAMLILLNVIGIVQPPSHDIDRFLEYELNTRTNDIKRQMNALAAHNIDLSQQLQQNPDAPPQANVLELNQFFEFLQSHSEQQAEKLRQLQSENNQVQKQYGMAALRLQEAQEKQKQTANQYIHLEEQLAALQNEIQQVRLQMEQTQQEKLQAQQEREQAQQQFNFAQAALEKAIEKKLESVDPDSYQMFIDNLATLTPKEEDIFNLYVQGCSTKDIISQLGITENTLKYHNKNIYSKLGVKTRKELLQYIELMRNAEH